MNIHDAFPSKYLKAGDLKGREVKVTIGGVTSEAVGQDKQPKLILHFVGKDRGMVLNKTNASMLATVLGPETDNWTGEEAILRSEMVSYQGNMVPGLRIHPVAAVAAPAPPVAAAPAPPVADPDDPGFDPDDDPLF